MIYEVNERRTLLRALRYKRQASNTEHLPVPSACASGLRIALPAGPTLRCSSYFNFDVRCFLISGLALLLAALTFVPQRTIAQLAGAPSDTPLTIATYGKTDAIIVVSPKAQEDSWEHRAAAELATFIEMIVGARPALANSPDAAGPDTPVFFVGQSALEVEPKLRQALAEVAKPDPVLRADAIVIQRDGNRVYLAGTNDDSHYYAVAELLRLWGCRWYLPTELGACIPMHDGLTVGAIDYVYAPPFEVRQGAAGYAWLGDNTGRKEFMRRNGMNELTVPCGHDLGKYVRDLVPEGGSTINVPIAEESTIRHVAEQVAPMFAEGKDFSLGIDDGAYKSDSELDATLMANLHDKYFQGQCLADNFMSLYNGVAEQLLEQHPDSPSRIGFFAYCNTTIPPQRNVKAAKPLVAYLAPIDIDPIHGMDDPRSPPRREYREMMHRWAKVMDGRVIIYDYDQGMLVWRDLPNPSHQAFRQDVRHYRDAGILGLHTETRGAYATVFLNLYLRGRLMWNPEADVEALLAEFYPAFYGPAAEPMQNYWSAIYRAWDDTIVTEHEFYAIPAIYTVALVAELRTHLAAAREAVTPLQERGEQGLNRNERLYLERFAFTEKSFEVIDRYTTMVRKGATEGDYGAAVEAGERGLAARQAMTDQNGILTSTRMEDGAAWFPGEVAQYRKLQALTDGSKGRLVAMLPLEWMFRRDPHDTGLAGGFAYQQADLTYWHENKEQYSTPAARKDYPTTEWEMLHTDLYAQAQGVLHPDRHSFTGFMWYKTDVDLTAGQADGKVRIHFPGLFSEAWLYVNGDLVAHRPQKHMWWYNDYTFDWDVDLDLKPGRNDIVLRVHNTHHNGGLFRRPFLYQPIEPPAKT